MNKTLIECVQIFGDAWARRDMPLLRALLAPDYTHTDFQGRVMRRDEWLDYARAQTHGRAISFRDLEVGNIFVPKGIDEGVHAPLVSALLINLSLIALFGIQHTLMARRAFKQRWGRLVPQPVERSTFVLCASLSLLLLFWQWRPLTTFIWNFPAGPMNVALMSLFWIGWLDVALSTFLINHFDQFGLRQVYLYLRGIAYTPVPFTQPSLYKYMRHPLMLGFLIAFWATPRMSVGHLIFAAGMTIYIFIGIAFEERDLLKAFGQTYEHYRKQVSMLIPMPRRK